MGAKAKNDWKELKKTLTLSKDDEKVLKRYLKGDHLRDNSMFDAVRGSRWIFDRAVKLGWIRPSMAASTETSPGITTIDTNTKLNELAKNTSG